MVSIADSARCTILYFGRRQIGIRLPRGDIRSMQQPGDQKQ
jgi:hypothetical protein